MPKKKKKKRTAKGREEGKFFPLPRKVKRMIWGLSFILLSIISFFSFFKLSGPAGEWLRGILTFLFGTVFFVLPVLFFFIALIILKTRYKRFSMPALIGFLLFVAGLSGIAKILSERNGFLNLDGGAIGHLVGFPLIKLFDVWIGSVVLFCFVIAGTMILRYLLKIPSSADPDSEGEKKGLISRFKKVIGRTSSFETKPIEYKKEEISIEKDRKEPAVEEKGKVKPIEKEEISYHLPPSDLLEGDKGAPNSGDTRINSSIIKKTLENFDIPVEMSEISVGPTVTQYTLKPAEGIKLSRITSLSNDLSLALAAHPIRIEAPIPGRSLVGVEIPNKIRAEIRMKDLVEHSSFRNSSSELPLVLGRDVSGTPQFANLEKMPHMLIAGATGSGKTIFLNTLILSLLYRNTPETLRLILVDPKRVEFANYSEIPHLLAPVIFDISKTCNALKWLIGEMERRLKVMADVKARDISSYNQIASKNNAKKSAEKMEQMPYIVLVVDELADLMASKGREVEAGIVRLAQMARAAGIHLVLATQRPSVEVITGLIKANITSRITFQVASQVDSRTILDVSGAEKLLGAGDLLFISGEISKPKRIQGPYISEKEIRDVVGWIKSQYKDFTEDEEDNAKDELSEELEKGLENGAEGLFDFPSGDDEEDALYEEAKKLVVETRKASASFLQRRLRIGYARAARLLDILEERGIVGPADGAKPREVYSQKEGENGDTWHKI